MDCESGFGAAVFVTGVVGFVAAGEVVRALTEASPSAKVSSELG
jgi:tRNA A37 threonylcarbamoyladenosine dehydratase